MNYGFVYPGGEALDAALCAQAAEAAGWQGFFVWEPIWGIDAWVSLTAAAMRTERIRLGTMITPLSRMRPWKLASETVTLDRLSNGRVIVAVGLGAIETGFFNFGEQTDRKTRAELLDEGLEVLTGLWRGQPFSFSGKHYTVTPAEFAPPPPPIQTPRIPIWAVGLWPSRKSMARAARLDGLLPAIKNPDGDFGQPTPDTIREIKAYLDTHRSAASNYDIVMEAPHTPIVTRPDTPQQVTDFEAAGATWWLESMWEYVETMFKPETQQQILARVQQGPPRGA
jgi:alkanesulfonate monooxygenase SsuD/methylene tetrahydromethanopterin reductase-like flavin-dependent oxidoreductase (luciferase family)